MPIAQKHIPRRYHARLEPAQERLKLFDPAAARLDLSAANPNQLVYPHTIWMLHAGKLMQGQTWTQSVRRSAWGYYLPGRRRHMVWVQLQIAARGSESISLSEGPMVDKAVRLVERAKADRRTRGVSFELRLLMAPALHVACVWLRGADRKEFFLPVTLEGGSLGDGEWLTRAELRQGLEVAGERHVAAERRREELHRSLKQAGNRAGSS
jgi:hypothetical protein